LTGPDERHDGGAVSDRPLALVTGASSGIGAAFAEDLAARGRDLIVVARRGERLRELASRLTERHRVGVEVCVADLATPTGRARVLEALDARDRAPEVAVLNAGFGSYGALVDLDPDREVEMVELNCLAVLALTRSLLPGMRGAGRGAVVVVSSAAAWQPIPYMATYAATKAFELALADAVREELRGTGVSVVSVLPGPTATEFGAAAGVPGGAGRGMPRSSPEEVVGATWRALARGRGRVSVGPIARLAAMASLGILRPIALRVAGLAGRRAARASRARA